MPDGNPAPPRPLRPEALISEMSYRSLSVQPSETMIEHLAYPIMPLQYNLLCLIPISIFLSTLQIRAMVPI